MSNPEPGQLEVRSIQRTPPVNAKSESLLFHSIERQRARDAWQKLIDLKLLEWLRDPGQLEDDGIDAPDPAIIRLSLDFAEDFRDKCLPAPDRIVPDPNGGIVFERSEGDVLETFHFWDDGQIEYMRFHARRLAERRTI